MEDRIKIVNAIMKTVYLEFGFFVPDENYGIPIGEIKTHSDNTETWD